MRITSRLTVAVHALLAAEYFKDDYKVTSEFIAASAGVNPVVVRRILSLLKRAGIVGVSRGSGGARLIKPPESVTLLDVYRAVDCGERDGMFRFHENPDKNCPVGGRIHGVLDGRLSSACDAFENSLAGVTLADLLAGLK